MTRIYPSVDQLEARIDHQAARIDALYRMLRAAGVIPGPLEPGSRDAFFDGLIPCEDAPLTRDRDAQPATARTSRLHVGEATGV